MLYQNTQKFLINENFAVTDDAIIDFKNKVFYKCYKVMQEEAINKMPSLLKNIKGLYVFIKTQNYNAAAFPALHKTLIMKEFQKEDYTQMTEEEIQTKAGKLFEKLKNYEELYNELADDINQITVNLVPKRTMYVFIPMKLNVNSSFLNEEQKKYNKNMAAINAKYASLLKSINKLQYKEYIDFVVEVNKMYSLAVKRLYETLIIPSITITSEKGGTDESYNNNSIMLQIENEASLFSLTGMNEIEGLINSIYYESLFFGDKYMTFLDVYNNILLTGKSGEKYFEIMKPLMLNFNSIDASNPITLVSSASKTQTYFVSGIKTIVSITDSFINDIDQISGNFDTLLKFQQINKEPIISIINDKIKSTKLKIESVVAKEEEAPEVLFGQREALKNDNDYFVELKNKLLDANEKLYAVSGYFFNHLLLKNQMTEFMNNTKRINIEIKVLPAQMNILSRLFDINYNISGFYVHTTPLLSSFNIYQNFKNNQIITSGDTKQIETMKEISKAGDWYGVY